MSEINTFGALTDTILLIDTSFLLGGETHRVSSSITTGLGGTACHSRGFTFPEDVERLLG